jgi:hypothetical protein
MAIKTCRYPESKRLDLSAEGYETITKKRLRRASPFSVVASIALARHDRMNRNHGS